MDESGHARLFVYLTTGIYILTTGTATDGHGMSASWVTQLSADPPLLGVALGKTYRTRNLVSTERRFALNVVGKRSRHLQDHFHIAASRGSGALDGVRVQPSPLGLPWLVDALASADCVVRDEIPVGDRVLFVATPVHWEIRNGDEPLTSLDLPYVFVGHLVPARWRRAAEESRS
jgi:flavin reductase (DIM6/NTAB) family NADH-FMN oxidoreductase RutF